MVRVEARGSHAPTEKERVEARGEVSGDGVPVGGRSEASGMVSGVGVWWVYGSVGCDVVQQEHGAVSGNGAPVGGRSDASEMVSGGGV